MEEVGVSGRISSPVSRDYKIWPEGTRGGFVPPSRALLDNRLALYVKPVEEGREGDREREREREECNGGGRKRRERRGWGKKGRKKEAEVSNSYEARL